MYSVASWPPRSPTPRPSIWSVERYRVCSRMRCAETVTFCPAVCAHTQAAAPITSNPIDLSMIVLVSLKGSLPWFHVRPHPHPFTCPGGRKYPHPPRGGGGV